MSDSPDAVAAKLREGLALLKSGQPAQARAVFHRVLETDPRQFDALHFLGVIALQLGDPAGAVELMGRAIAVNAEHAPAHNNLGAAFIALGRHAEAAESFGRAVTLDANYAEAAINHGNTLLTLKRPQEAVQSYTLALAQRPGEAATFNNRGTALKSLGQHTEALADFERAIALQPDLGDAHYNRGNALLALKHYAAAVDSYDRAIALKPTDAAIQNNRANALRKLKRFADARAGYDAALAHDPAYVDAVHNRGAVWGDMGEHEAAIADYDRAIAQDPTYADAYNSRGLALRELRRHGEAVDSHRRALALDPSHTDARWSLAVCHLQMGNFAEGWKDYAARWQAPQLNLDPRNFTQPLWQGQDLAGKTILLHAEQGLGDTLQFVRYVRLVAATAARVILEVQPPLVTLLQNLANQVIAKGDPLPPFDVHCPLLTLPLVFGTDATTIPAAQGYLTAAPTKRMAWAERLGAKTQPRIGLAWSGNPSHTNDARRSVPLADIIRALPKGFSYVALQKDVAAGDRAILADAGIAVFGEDLADFSDTAALCTLMDTVISVDTSIAHLAGALGVPVWILLPFNPDWRWLLDRTDSPWYDTAVLYQQETPGDWAGVLARIALALTQKIADMR